MATLLAVANGNLSDANIFAVAEIGTGSFQPVRNQNGNFSSPATQASAAFTVTSGKVIDAALLWMKNIAGSTGTVKVDLLKGGVSQASVTVNKSDLPDQAINVPVPVIFKFTSTATGDGAANWTLVITTTGTGSISISYYASGGANFTRILRTTTLATAAAADDLYIVGELTGAGTKNPRAITMSSTTPVAYGSGVLNTTTVNGGGIHISNWASLSYLNAASTNYVLRVNGDVWVYCTGTLNIGAVGAEIPRSSTAVLEIQPTGGDGDFGLRCWDYSVVNMAGLSRTAGKNVVKCKLTSDTVFSNTLNTSGMYNGAWQQNALDPTGNTVNYLWSYNDNATNGPHGWYINGPTLVNITQTTVTWLARGSGLNNRYVRLTMGNSTTLTSVTNGFYVDVDLQAGTVGTCTAIGNGTAISASINPCGVGHTIKFTGKVSTTSTTTYFHVSSCAVAGVTSYVGNSTQCFIWDRSMTQSASSIPDTVFNVDADTGWLAGDAIVVASTTRNQADTEIFPLTANASANALTSSLCVSATHSGISPAQAEVGLLTRNVKVRSTSNLNMMFIYCTSLATFNASWTEFYYGGLSSTAKRMIEIDAGTVTNPKSITYCSLHDAEYGVWINSGVSINLTFSNNILWWVWGTYAFNFGTIANDDWVIDNNLFMRVAQMIIYDCGGTLTNNTVVSCSNTWSIAAEGGNTVKKIGLISNNCVHSSNTGMTVNGFYAGDIVDCKIWRNGNWGLKVEGGHSNDLVFVNPLIFGNYSNSTYGNVTLYSDVLNIKGGIISSEISYTVPVAIRVDQGSLCRVNLFNVDMSGTGGNGLFAPHTAYDLFFNGGGSVCNVHGIVSNCKFGAMSPLSYMTPIGPGAALGFMNFNQVTGDHRTETGRGQLRTDYTNYRATAPSMRMSPISNAFKLESGPAPHGMLVAVNNGQAATVSVYVRKDPSYIGAQPRLMLRANPAVGANNDIVLATSTGTTGTPAYAAFGNNYSSVVLSNNNLTVTNALGNVYNIDMGARVGTPAGEKTSGKYYFEYTHNLLSGFVSSFGIAPPTTSFGAFGSSCGGNGAGMANNGWLYVNGGTQISFGGPSNGTVYCFAVDLDNRLIWTKSGITGNWNNNAAYNPATSTGGVAIPAGPMAPMVAYFVSGLIAGNVTTANFGASAFAGAVPAGFIAGWPMNAGTPGTGTWDMLSGTSPVALSDGAFEFYVDCDGQGGFINVDDWTATTSMVGYAPANTVVPVASGSTISGGTVNTTSGTWVGVPTPTLAYQWKRNGANIAGATSSSYVLTDSDIGTIITATVTATNSVGSVSLTTNGMGPVTAPLPLWLPSQLATLKLWLKGDSNTGANGSAITTWADASGLNNNATGSTSKPTVAAAHLNGLNTVRFTDASAQSFSLPNFLTGLTSGSVIWVAKLVTDPPSGSAGGITKFGNDYTINADNHYPYSDSVIHDDFGNASRRSLGTRPGNFTNWHISSMHAAAADFRMYINSAQFYSTATNTVAWSPTPTISKGQKSGSENYIDGWVAELIFVNETLSMSNRQKLEGYLAYKWGLQSVLPAGHPYKTSPPLSGGDYPTTLTGLIGWWDASVPSSLTLTGSSIDAIADQSGAGNNLSWLNVKPTYNATGFNSRPAFVFNGTQAFTNAAFPLGTGDTITIWWVGNSVTAGAGADWPSMVSYMASGQTADYTNMQSFTISRPSGSSTQLSMLRVGSLPVPFTSDINHRVIITINSSGVQTFYVDGVAVTGATTPGNWGSPGVLRIGRNGTNTAYWAGPHGELGIATGYHDATVVANLDSYLKTKWGL